MKFLNEGSNTITICKYRKSDILFKGNFALIIGKYKNDGTRLPPLNFDRIFIHKSQFVIIASYVYIPEDQIEERPGYRYPEPIACKTMQKYEWKDIKTRY